MSVNTSHPAMPTSPKTVASLAAPTLLQHPFSQKEADIIEFRLDALVSQIQQVKDTLIQLKKSPLQSLITARCITEGGKLDIPAEHRIQLLKALCPLATFVDIELANYELMRSAAEYAQSMNSLVIASYHDFKSTPTTADLKEKVSQAIDAGADIAKIAVYHNSLEDVYRCADFMQQGSSIAVSLMGMGPLAPTSRLLYAQLGSVLNYGYLGNTSTAPGQWPASLLHEAISKTVPF